MPHIPRFGLPTPSPASIAAADPSNPLPEFIGTVVELDVREELRSGHEPFSIIMAAVDALAPDETLRLRATFEPAPLFRVLGKRGYEHHSVAHAPDDWSIWFYPSAADADTPVASAPTAGVSQGAGAAPAAAPNEIVIDVRGLEPPEPMVRTLETLESLPAGTVLIQLNDRLPQFLLPILAERGFRHEAEDMSDGGVRVRISRAGSEQFTGGGDPAPDRARTPAVPTHHPKGVAMSATEIDVRVIPPRDKHPTIFRALDTLPSGEAILLINDHDPAPLRYQLLAEHPDTFDWTYDMQGPDEWRVRIARR